MILLIILRKDCFHNFIVSKKWLKENFVDQGWGNQRFAPVVLCFHETPKEIVLFVRGNRSSHSAQKVKKVRQ